MDVRSRDCRLPNGILLNGVWKDYYDVIVTASEKERLSDEIIGFSAEDRDSLAVERSQLLSDWRASICSLTSIETSHLHAKQIIDKVRVEKDNLEMKCKSFEAQRDWLDRQRSDLRNQLLLMAAEVDLLGLKLRQQDAELLCEKSEIHTLSEIIQKRDQTIKNMTCKSEKQSDDLNTLSKSLSTKDRQFQILLKERNRQKEELERAAVEIEKLKRFQRNQQTANQDHHNTAFSTPLKSERDRGGLIQKTNSNSPGEKTDAETPSPFSAINTTTDETYSPYRGEDGALSSVQRKLLDGDGNTLKGLPPLPFVSEDNIEMRDKIYRSIIKKLQKQLTIAQNQISSISLLPARKGFTISDRKTVTTKTKAFS